MTWGRGQPQIGTEEVFILGNMSRSLATLGLHPEVPLSRLGSGLMQEK